MTRARTELIALDTTPYYHVISRCVRRAFLCGEDSLTSKSYEHRKAWIVERLAELDIAFAIDIASYSVMSNHYHLVLRVDKQTANNFSNDEVMERWHKLFTIPLLVSRYFNGETMTRAECDTADAYMDVGGRAMQEQLPRSCSHYGVSASVISPGICVA